MDKRETSGDEGSRGDALPQVTVYTSNDCVWCVKAKEYLARRGVPYIERNVEVDEAAGPEVIRLSGQRHVPVITVGSRVIVGFQHRELERELGQALQDA